MKFEKAISKHKLVLVDFYAKWCGPCKTMDPILRELISNSDDSTEMVKIDVDASRSLATRYQIRSIPTLILFKKGKPVWRQSGVISKNSLEKIIHQYNV